MLSAWGVWSVLRTPLDALPDLSDVQVIIRTTYPGQAPRIVENQVTYPLTTTMLSVPGAKTVRGYSFFGDSFVYVLFDDGTDLYWARSRVLEYLNQVQSRCRRGASRRSGRTPPAWAGSTSTRWSTAAARMTWRSCARCRTGS
jgi:Cu(I)/Ag(I) efflux system membrane protein CusA/SilA